MTAQVTLDNCEREPIHIPGAVQPHGVLLACRGESLTVTQVSANAADCFGRTPDAIRGQPLADLFAGAHAGTIRDLGSRASLRDANPVRLEIVHGPAARSGPAPQLASRFAPATPWDGVAAGLLSTTLSRELGEYLLWFRPSIDRTAALRAGFQAHVPKPADREELVTVVASVVKRI